MSEGLIGLAHIGVYTKDLNASIAFYQKLGFTLDGVSTPGAKLGFLHLGSCILELIQPPDLSRLEGLGGGVIAHLAIECKNIEAVVDTLKAEGIIAPDAAISTSDMIMDGIKNIFFTGPSGERIELLCYYKRG